MKISGAKVFWLAERSGPVEYDPLPGADRTLPNLHLEGLASAWPTWSRLTSAGPTWRLSMAIPRYAEGLHDHKLVACVRRAWLCLGAMPPTCDDACT